MRTAVQTQIQVIKMHKDFPIADLKPFPRNPRHNQSAIDAVEKSLTAFGAIAPIVADENGRIAAGHTRYEAAIRAGLSTFPVIVCKFPDENSFVGYNITDNQTASIAVWDDTELAKLLVELGEDDFDVSVLAFDPCELDDILKRGGQAPEPGCDPDDVPETPVEPITKLGDLWLLGDHRLLCGDATKAEDVERLMDGEKAQMMFTDPPYGVNYEGGHFNPYRDKLKGDQSPEVYSRFLPVVMPYIDGPCYIWFAGSKARIVYDAVEDNGFQIHALLIWHKINATYAAMNAQYKQRHEPCLYCKPKGSTLRWCGPTDECTVWEERRDGRNDYHPTQKPVALADRAIRNHNADLVADFFLGSSTTIIAAERLHRKCYGMEIEPKYVDVAVKRWEIFTGKKAVGHAA